MIVAILLLSVGGLDGEAAVARARTFLQDAGVRHRIRLASVKRTEWAKERAVWSVQFSGKPSWHINLDGQTGRVLRAWTGQAYPLHSSKSVGQLRPSEPKARAVIEAEKREGDVRLTSYLASKGAAILHYSVFTDGLRFVNTGPRLGSYQVVFAGNPGQLVSFSWEGEVPPVDGRPIQMDQPTASRLAENFFLGGESGQKPEAILSRRYRGQFWFLRAGESTARRVWLFVFTGKPPKGGLSYFKMVALLSAEIMVDAVTGEVFVPISFRSEWIDAY